MSLERTVTNGPSSPKRVVTYTPPDGVSLGPLSLDFTKMSIRRENVTIGRQQIYTDWTFRLRFHIHGESELDLQTTILAAQRILNQRGGTLEVTIAGQMVVKAAPAGKDVAISATSLAAGDDQVEKILLDVANGPEPQLVHIDAIQGGRHAVCWWEIRVRAIAEDALAGKDDTNQILGISASAEYAISQEGYVTRVIQGVAYLKHGRLARLSNEPLARDTKYDAWFRKALMKDHAARMLWKSFARPKGSIRKEQRYKIDETENAMNFVIVDQEVYRQFPDGIANGEANLTVQSNGGKSDVLTILKVFEGWYEGSPQTSYFDVMKAVIDQAMVALNAENDFVFINKYRIRTDIYRNRISFSFSAIQPFAAFADKIAVTCGLHNNYKQGKFPDTQFGRTGLVGSAYRLQQNAYGADDETTETQATRPNTTGGMPGDFDNEVDYAKDRKLTIQVAFAWTKTSVLSAPGVGMARAIGIASAMGNVAAYTQFKTGSDVYGVRVKSKLIIHHAKSKPLLVKNAAESWVKNLDMDEWSKYGVVSEPKIVMGVSKPGTLTTTMQTPMRVSFDIQLNAATMAAIKATFGTDEFGFQAWLEPGNTHGIWAGKGNLLEFATAGKKTEATQTSEE